MSINAVREIATGRGITSDEKGVRRLTRVYQVETTSQYDEQLTVLSASGVPRRGDFYSTTNGTADINLTVRSVSAQQQSDSRLHWTVTVEYSDQREGEDNETPPDPNPLLRPAVISRSFSSFQKVIEKGECLTDGSTDFGRDVPIYNSARMPFVPPPMIDDDRYTLTITKNFASFDDSFWRPYHNSINSNSFLGADAHTLKLRIASVPPKKFESVNDVNVGFFEVTVELMYRPETWHYIPLDSGYYKIKNAAAAASTDWEEIKNSDGQPYNTPPLLDGTGQPLVAGEDPIFLKYRVYEEKNFSLLGLI